MTSGDVNLTRLESQDGQLLRELASLENMAALMERVRSLQVWSLVDIDCIIANCMHKGCL